MELFVNQYVCTSLAHCKACRTNKAWREGHAAAYQWDEARTCPIGLPIADVPQPSEISHASNPAEPPETQRERYRRLWATAHLRAAYPPSDLSGELKWIDSEITLKLGCGECIGNWQAALVRTPPDLSSPEAYAGWWVDRHDEVRALQGLPPTGREAGIRKWAGIRETFDAVYVLSLPQDNERRLKGFFANIKPMWPFRQPEVVEGIDGNAVRHPEGATGGCMLSHKKILLKAMRAGRNSILILEDDAVFKPDFAASVADFLDSVPADWDSIFFGHQNADWVQGKPWKPESVSPGVVRTPHPHRLHAYALRGNAIAETFYQMAQSWGHADHAVGEMLGNMKTYAPDPPLAGQAEGYSHLLGQWQGPRWWGSNPDHNKRGVIVLDAGGSRLRPNARLSMIEAARRWGAELRVVTQFNGPENGVGQKLYLDQIGRDFDQVVYLDRDIVIRDSCPNLFEINDGIFAAALDEDVATGAFQHGRNQMDDACRKVGLPIGLDYFNSGVMVFNPGKHSAIFATARNISAQLPRDWPFFDQGLLSLAVHLSKTPYKVLPFAYNSCSLEFWSRIRTGVEPIEEVLHFCGQGDRDSFIDSAERENHVEAIGVSGDFDGDVDVVRADAASSPVDVSV